MQNQQKQQFINQNKMVPRMQKLRALIFYYDVFVKSISANHQLLICDSLDDITNEHDVDTCLLKTINNIKDLRLAVQ